MIAKLAQNVRIGVIWGKNKIFLIIIFRFNAFNKTVNQLANIFIDPIIFIDFCFFFLILSNFGFFRNLSPNGYFSQSCFQFLLSRDLFQREDLFGLFALCQINICKGALRQKFRRFHCNVTLWKVDRKFLVTFLLWISTWPKKLFKHC